MKQLIVSKVIYVAVMW